MTYRYNIKDQIFVRQGEARDLILTILADGVALDLSGATVTARIGRLGNEQMKTPTVSLTTPASGILTVEIAAADTDLPPGIYVLEVRRTSGDVLTLACGQLVIDDSLFGEG